jgi:replicative DNA helicase
MESISSNLYFNKQAEESILGCILVKDSLIDELQFEKVTASDFFIAAHQHIYKAMLAINQRDEPIDIITVTAELRHVIAEIGGVTYLTELANAVPTTANLKYYIELLKRETTKRFALNFSKDINRILDEDSFDNPEELLGLIDSEFSHSRPEPIAQPKTVGETAENYFEFLNTKNDLVPTGFKKFDEWAGGYGRGKLIIKAGRPGVGKTAKATQEALYMSSTGNGPVLFWSLEMGVNELKTRMLCNLGGINYARAHRKEPDEVNKLIKTHEKFDGIPLFLFETPAVTFDQIRAIARQMHRKHGQIGAIFVDYLQIMQINQEKSETKSAAVGRVTRRFKWLAQELNCPVIVLAQLNREGAEGAPQLHHLRDSGEIEQDADMIEFLWLETEEKEKIEKTVKSNIAKGRATGQSSFEYLFMGQFQRYKDL